MSAAPAAEFLAHARTIAPAAKRVLVVPRGGPAQLACSGAAGG
jgi:hypothetical protein